MQLVTLYIVARVHIFLKVKVGLFIYLFAGNHLYYHTLTTHCKKTLFYGRFYSFSCKI